MKPASTRQKFGLLRGCSFYFVVIKPQVLLKEQKFLLYMMSDANIDFIVQIFAAVIKLELGSEEAHVVNKS